MAVLISALAAGCEGRSGRDPILGIGSIAGIAPTVTTVAPVDKATDVSINTSTIAAAFSEPMAAIGGTSFTVTCAAPCANPTGTVTLNAANRVATFALTPATDLEPLTAYTVTLSGARSLATGIALASPYVWRFTTGVATDLTAPKVSSTSPLPSASGVAINTLVIAGFSESMNPLTITTATFTVACPAGTPITGVVGYAVNGNVATFTPTRNLPISTSCTATIAAGVEDAAANGMAEAFSWSFTTGAAPDTAGPAVSSTSPPANGSGIAINTLIAASFSEPMDPLTVTAATFTLACPAGAPITGTVSYAVNGNVAAFTPAGNLPAGTPCTAKIGTGVKDVAGNALGTAYSWIFTTGVAPDTTAPTVSSTSPFTNDSDVAINALITASFSEPMDPLTITTANFTLSCPAGTPIIGTVGYAVNGNVATFTPASNLPSITTCTAEVTTGVKDVAENGMAAVASWVFTTGSAPDTVPPTVSSTSPLAGDSGVAINTLITASFSESMDMALWATSLTPLAIRAVQAVLAGRLLAGVKVATLPFTA